jgi:hypothetical protein
MSGKGHQRPGKQGEGLMGNAKGSGKAKAKAREVATERAKGKVESPTNATLAIASLSLMVWGRKTKFVIIGQGEMGFANMGRTATINMRGHKEERREEQMRRHCLPQEARRNRGGN